MQQNRVRLDRVTHLVLDEADRMLDMGFVRDVRKIVATLPKRRQSMFFSATMPPEVSKLANEMLSSPVRVEVTPQVITVDKIRQHVHFVNAAEKRGLLVKLLGDPALARVLVFTRTKHGANKVADVLERAQVGVEAIHGNKSQNARQRALERFRSGECRVLVATDIAARGIDVAEIGHVVNFDLPHVPEDYVHRIGRTARMEASGRASSFAAPDEQVQLRDIERLTRKQIPRHEVPRDSETFKTELKRAAEGQAHPGASAQPAGFNRNRRRAAAHNEQRGAGGQGASHGSSRKPESGSSRPASGGRPGGEGSGPRKSTTVGSWKPKRR
jgi:ATP-dependent RNA helicase RhlE